MEYRLKKKQNPIAELFALSRTGKRNVAGGGASYDYSAESGGRAAELMEGLTYEDARAFEKVRIGPRRRQYEFRTAKNPKEPTGVMSRTHRSGFLTSAARLYQPPATRAELSGPRGMTGGAKLSDLTGHATSILGGRARTKRAAGRVTEPLAARRARMRSGEQSRAARLLSTGQALGSAGVLG
jgi:hypothetical protein